MAGTREQFEADRENIGLNHERSFTPMISSRTAHSVDVSDKALTDYAVRRYRSFAEVRIAWQVSHPNICLACDIANSRAVTYSHVKHEW